MPRPFDVRFIDADPTVPTFCEHDAHRGVLDRAAGAGIEVAVADDEERSRTVDQLDAGGSAVGRNGHQVDVDRRVFDVDRGAVRGVDRSTIRRLAAVDVEGSGIVGRSPVPLTLVISSKAKVVVPELFCRLTPGLMVEPTTLTVPNVTLPDESATEMAEGWFLLHR